MLWYNELSKSNWWNVEWNIGVNCHHHCIYCIRGLDCFQHVSLVPCLNQDLQHSALIMHHLFPICIVSDPYRHRHQHFGAVDSTSHRSTLLVDCGGDMLIIIQWYYFLDVYLHNYTWTFTCDKRDWEHSYCEDWITAGTNNVSIKYGHLCCCDWPPVLPNELWFIIIPVIVDPVAHIGL